ncbi:hypothetical protein [Natrinema gelatinilyticum]|uniref:hypothetical protein n=1 Tax=Natrinema gelatinilyticum TaxID=2961571 RepID=UPI0020C4AFB8|nr:hypothetical protein [Natrinema gelatinilyticum]
MIGLRDTLGTSLALLRLRSYLVPGTPTLTRQHLSERVLERFGKSPANAPTVETVTPAERIRILTAVDTATSWPGSNCYGAAIRPASVQWPQRWNPQRLRQPRIAVHAACDACDQPLADLVVTDSRASRGSSLRECGLPRCER